MLGLTRGVSTLIGVAGAVALVWLASQVGDNSTADYWALYGLVAAGGLVVALSQLLGGWTKWGWPTLSPSVLVLGFLPALLVAGWVLAVGQPNENWLQETAVDWADGLGLEGVIDDLLDLAGPLAFLAGLAFGLTFDTTGPRRRPERVEPPPPEKVEPGPRPVDEEAPSEVRDAREPEETVTRR
jgi:hypothetical protein